MNILPFVMIFIMIFTYFSFSFFTKNKMFTKEKKGYTHYYCANRSLQSKQQDFSYQHQKVIQEKSSSISFDAPISEIEKEEKPYFSPRLIYPPKSGSQFNLASAFYNDSDIERKAAISLMQHLYTDLFVAKKFELSFEELFNALQRKALKLSTDEEKTSYHLLDLFPEKDLEKQAFYLLIKGSAFYEENKGYPPLGDFFNFDPQMRKKPLCFKLSSKQTLASIFNPHIAQEILDAEKNKKAKSLSQKILTKKELSELLQNFSQAEIEKLDLFYFISPRKNLEQISYKDPNSNISLRRKS